ncbi:MAG: flagellar hook-basal body complex protein, partial [Candidatus Eisenbacteria bacterium]|nr:flagellar hook-basal body complex protein [Candidatus Eisenbacteria bacterium]
MMKSLGTTAKTLAYYQQRQQIAAANVAQANTTSYKAIHAAAQGTDPGHPVGQEYTDWTQGALRETGRPLDLSLDGPGFFVVENQEGNQRLSRGGTFQLDAGGWLVDLAGNKVIGETGPMLLLG